MQRSNVTIRPAPKDIRMKKDFLEIFVRFDTMMKEDIFSNADIS